MGNMMKGPEISAIRPVIPVEVVQRSYMVFIKYG